MKLQFGISPDLGYQALVGPGQAGLANVGMDVLRLSAGTSYTARSEGRELALVILSGRCDISCGGQAWSGIGERASVFGGHATSVFVPSGASYQIRALTDLEIAVAWAPTGETGLEPRLIRPNDVKSRTVGKGGAARTVEDIIDNDFKAARLLVGETFTPPGHWSSYPPHKHDVDNPPREVDLEEIYLYKVNPAQGFGLQRLYTADGTRDEAVVIHDDDVVALPDGYHPVAAAPGYSVYYLWALAGQGRTMAPNDDPDHAWVKEA